VQIFVSNHLIPEEFEFSALDDPCYVSQDEEVSPNCTHALLSRVWSRCCIQGARAPGFGTKPAHASGLELS
jgi:hypothetical protein